MEGKLRLKMTKRYYIIFSIFLISFFSLGCIGEIEEKANEENMTKDKLIKIQDELDFSLYVHTKTGVVYMYSVHDIPASGGRHTTFFPLYDQNGDLYSGDACDLI